MRVTTYSRHIEMLGMIVALAVTLAGCKSNVYETDAADARDVQHADTEDTADPSDVSDDVRDTDDDGTSDTRDTDDTRDPGGLQDDPDDDGIINANDNCDLTPNPLQKDSDRDGVGNACDNCTFVANADQEQVDCERQCPGIHADEDGDGIPGADDNCPDESNPSQTDSDGDVVGDACDNCQDEPNAAQTDSDGDGIGDVCEPSPSAAGDIDICYEATEAFDAPRSNIYFVLDASTSSNPVVDFSTLSGAMDTAASQLADLANIGVMTYGGSNCADATEQLAMGDHSAADIQASYAGVQPSGDRPLAGALQSIVADQRYELPDGPDASERKTSVIVLTHGDMNACGGHTDALAAAEALSDAGVSMYVVASASPTTSAANLSALAQAGATNDYYEANSEAAIRRVLGDITREQLGCVHDVPPGAEELESRAVWVDIDGQSISEDPGDGFTYYNRQIELHGSACRSLLAGTAGEPTTLDVWVGCQQQCFEGSEDDWCETPEACDGRDNDCDGVVDEHCPDLSCAPEVCNGEDTNCDGVVDNGCPDCRGIGGRCQSDEDCCSDLCVQGMCQQVCAEAGRACRSDEDCCVGECLTSDDDTGFCAAD